MRENIQKELDALDVPEASMELWDVFLDLFTGEGISYTEILSYCVLHKCTLTPDEIDLLRNMDRVGCAAANAIRFPKKNK